MSKLMLPVGQREMHQIQILKPINQKQGLCFVKELVGRKMVKR